jgi:hypothetical protein
VAAPEIGVLVPLRLETRFVGRGSPTRWRLRVRIVPDAVSITNHDERPSEAELDAVEAMWRAAGGHGLESAAGRRAWRDLAAAVGAERAAWLARTFPPVTGSGGQITITRPSETRTEMRAPRVLGLPPTLEIWIARGGQAPAQAARLTVLTSEIDLDLDDPTSTKQPWWTSFPEAVRVGLAAEIDLGMQSPDDIDALYVVGIGGGDPGPLLAAQADSGRLGIVPPGSATNTVNGEAALSLGDVDEWRRLVPVGPTVQAGTAAVSTTLAGAPLVRGVIGGENDHRPLNRALVGTLWPALWGHSLANVWGFDSRADELGLWAADNLVPEGPLPSMRIEEQPYGLLPATSLRRWAAATGDPAIEARLVPLVRGLVDAWAAAAERQAAQRQGDGLRDLVRNPTAARYAWRWMVPTTLAHALSFRFNQSVAAADLDSWWTRQARQTPRLDPAATPARQLVSVGWSHDVGVGLVEPADLPQGTTTGKGLSRLAGASVTELLAAGPVEGRPRTAPPWGTSLLTELARHSLLASSAAVARRVAGQPRALVEPVSVNVQTATETETWATRLQPLDLNRRGEPAVGVRRNVVDGLKALAKENVADIDRGLRAALETATRRIDPWATAIAWRRLQTLAAAPRTLGAYGWVDAPRPQTAGDHRFTLAPSIEQAAVTAVLRDRALHDPDADRWRMTLASDAIRAALRLADDTRAGSHPTESLGQMVEAIVNRPDVIDRLRAAFPTIQIFLRSDFRVRRVCNGAAVLDAAQNRPDDLRQLGVRAAQVTALQELAAAVDALADLHVAESVFGVVKGRTANVAAATTAAGGQAPPPAFDVVRTPRSGRVVNTVAVMVLPNAPKPGGAQPSPAALADPAVAAYLDARSGSASSAAWRWTTLDATGQPVGTVTLADVGLRPCDTVGLGTVNLRDVVRDVSGAVGLGPGDPPGHAVVRALAAALAGVPALAEDVGAEPDPADAAAAELAQRYGAVRAAAVAAAADARAATASTATANAQRKALGRLARWGITPLAAETADVTIGGLADRLARAAEVLERRVGEAPETIAGASVSVLAASIGALVAPEGPWPVFSRLPESAFTGVRAEPAGGGQAPRLDPDWLETVAPVRPALARLEAVQLDQRLRSGGQPLRAWSSRPGDPWQTVPPPPSDVEVVRASRLTAAFGPPNVLPARPNANTPGTVAVGVIDRLGETIPDPEHISSVAFSHDLPPGRAPQALVLAVPPVVDAELTPAVLVDIVAEVRALARARMADTADMGAATGALHLAALPASGRAGVQLGAP